MKQYFTTNPLAYVYANGCKISGENIPLNAKLYHISIVVNMTWNHRCPYIYTYDDLVNCIDVIYVNYKNCKFTTNTYTLEGCTEISKSCSYYSGYEIEIQPMQFNIKFQIPEIK